MCDGKHLWPFLHSKVHISFVIKENGICHPKIWPLNELLEHKHSFVHYVEINVLTAK